jgi:Lsr2
MAQTVIVTVTDDIDGSEGAETVSFSFAGQGYEIDLSQKNHDKFKKGLQPFIDAGRRVSRQGATRTARSRTSRNNSGAIRAWAAEQGLTVSERGRIPASIMAKYEAAHRA